MKRSTHIHDAARLKRRGLHLAAAAASAFVAAGVIIAPAAAGAAPMPDSPVASSKSEEPPPDPDAFRDATASMPTADPAQPGEQLAANLAGPGVQGGYTMPQFLDYVLNDVTTFWSGIWANTNLPAPTVTPVFPGPGETVNTSHCGASNDDSLFYCIGDDEIVISQAAAQKLWEGNYKDPSNPNAGSGYPAGDFSVAIAVAHEYAHSLQDDLGIFKQGFPVYKTELHADCWAGVWARSTFDKGTIQEGDIEEAVRTMRDIGGYNFDPNTFHGTPDQRYDALMTGWTSGDPDQACSKYLFSEYTTEAPA